jgi:uncharacterized protein (DUF1697 family)
VTSHVAFLRAINTGGRRIANDELTAAVEAIGFTDVSVYQASGNVLIAGEPSSAGDLIAERIAEGLLGSLGYEVPTIVRSSSEVSALANATPFDGEPPPPGCKPQVILLANEPLDPSVVDAFSTGADRLQLGGADIHWWPTVGISTSELDVRALERTVGTMTVRTHGTIQRIAKRIA